MSLIYAHTYAVPRHIKERDVQVHRIAVSDGSHQDSLFHFMHALQQDEGWVETYNESIYFCGLFLNVRHSNNGEVTFEINNKDRKAAEAFDRYLAAEAVGRFGLTHTQPVPQIKGAGK